jgi:hypothetical protein
VNGATAGGNTPSEQNYFSLDSSIAAGTRRARRLETRKRLEIRAMEFPSFGDPFRNSKKLQIYKARNAHREPPCFRKSHIAGMKPCVEGARTTTPNELTDKVVRAIHGSDLTASAKHLKCKFHQLSCGMGKP